MVGRKVKQWPIILSCTLVLASVPSLLTPPPAAACWFGFGCRPKSVGKAKGSTPGSARRDSDVCRSRTLPLTALVPETDGAVKTSAAYPVFWFYLPTLTAAADPTQTPAIKLKFVLQDEQHRDVYETRFALPDAPPGVIGLRFGSAKAALESGKTYRWYFLAYCNDPDEIYEPTFVEGLIQREALSADRQSQIDQQEPQKRVLAYAEAGLWYDTLAELAAIESPLAPSTLKSDDKVTWANALQAVSVPTEIAQHTPLSHYYVRDNPSDP
jgi:Domain of Unknown Function (DUF928)